MKRQNKLISLLLSLFLLLFTLIPQSALTVKAEGNSEMAVHFIDVGQGNAILVQSGGQNLLYDGGDQFYFRTTDVTGVCNLPPSCDRSAA